MNENNLTPFAYRVTREMREGLHRNRGAVIWFTGFSGSGKSTLASALEERLNRLGCGTYILDGDAVRSGLNRDLGFSREERTENIRRAAEAARLFQDAGILAIVSFISPFRTDRDFARSLVEPGRFVEVYAKCPLETCEKRDPKGIYKKARRGEIPDFTGIDSPYEPPEYPEITIETDRTGIREGTDVILTFLFEKGLIDGPS